tara:strand:- start:846 stop:1952 length:1107 start_codon:yes stop_codon:yes gene_type:complete
MPALTSKQQFELKKFVKELSEYRGRHTELVSVYIPHGYDIIKVIQHLEQEKGTASNIKSTATRKNVQDALERMIQHLRLYKRTPANGLAAFAGNVSGQQGRSDVEVWSLEPPVPLNQRLYRCDKTFILEPLADMMEIKECYGLIVMDRRDASIALLKGKTIIPLRKTHSEVPGKQRAGGQSAQRFARLREGAAKDHYKKVADYVKTEFLHLKELKGILVGGPGPTKHDFIEQITTELKNKIIAVKDLSYTDDFGLQELVEKSKDVLANEEIMAEKKIMTKFLTLLAREPGKAGYGEKQVYAKLEMGVVETVLLSEVLPDETIEKFEEKAEELGSEVSIISTETREGIQLRDLGKVAAIYRFDVGEDNS